MRIHIHCRLRHTRINICTLYQDNPANPCDLCACLVVLSLPLPSIPTAHGAYRVVLSLPSPSIPSSHGIVSSSPPTSVVVAVGVRCRCRAFFVLMLLLSVFLLFFVGAVVIVFLYSTAAQYSPLVTQDFRIHTNHPEMLLGVCCWKTTKRPRKIG